MFYLYHHNDLSRLAELFGALRLSRPVSPLATDTVLAPNAGIGRWLRIQLAESEGIAANIDGRLPGEFIWALLHATLDEAEAGDHFEPPCLPWHLYAALPEIAREVPAVADYLGTPVDEVRRYQLARQLADVFDQYLIYRADTLAAWEAGQVPADNPGRWQARVWHWLTRDDRLGTNHRARVLTRFIERLGRDTALQQRVIAACPDNLYCFGLVALAPDHLRLLYALAEHIDVHFLLPNPSEAYWGDIIAGRLPLDLPAAETGDDAALLPGEATVEAGHPLLSALGRMARDTLRVLYSDEFAGMIEPELGELLDYDIPPNDTLLHRIQADIVTLDCRDSAQGMAEGDTSFEVHACHSPLREIQVLQDQLLDRLAADDARVAAGELDADQRLAPRHIIVMLPDVAAYAPAIQAVFGGAPAARYLPFGLADRARSAAHPIVTTVSALLDLPLARWTASALMDLLAVPAVMRRFGLTAADLDTLADWIDAAGVRWGRDAAHRAELGAGAFEQNTWRFGLDRLLLGVAQADEETLIDGIAPWADLEGGATAALGKLWRFQDTLARLAKNMARPATPGEWQTRLNAMLDDLVAPAPDAPDEQRAVDSLRGVFARFEAAEACTTARPLTDDRRLSWAAVRDDLRTTLDATAERQPFLSGGITFCGMVPLRAVPFRMVCVLGMNDAAFPRQDTGRAFNVMHNAPRLGDRNTRDDDRLLFLQALTAAGEAFYISYIGQDVATGEALPPSPIVGETLEFLRRHYFRAWETEDFNARLIHRQPMQPFSARYFDPGESDPRIFTYAGQWRDATRAALSPRDALAPLMDDSQAPLPEPITAIDLESLKRFFDHPPRAFFRERVQLALEIDDHRLDDAEPIGLNGLAAAGLRDRLFATAIATEAGELSPAPSALERARGTLPPPPLAAPHYAAQAEIVNELLPIWQGWTAEGTPETLDIQLDLPVDDGPVRLTGRVPQCWPGALRRLRTGKLRTRFRLRYWIDYLAAVAAGHDLALELAGVSPKPKDESIVRYAGRLDADTARVELAALIQHYIQGQQQPLAYHPDLDDGYQPDQNKAFDNLSFGFKPGAFFQHHLLRDAYFCLLLGPDDAPLGETDDTSPFIAAIEAISGPMNAVVRPAEADREVSA
ncbi:exodeoxyribonuclease V subunit gamma [Salinisphaera sp. Q1T1-3]|uniref:exodeoxyribonuclease V subunit gamma n=1 Tax=Salinisphaera sp. Q1T1-3 TaxID=2321229 RepID=UPI000E74E184|nr:exodeoxyribonuclease V subunit gamma [Salinisphaera sp. Q1T1-3]RJS91047.1 exodeoxyribonuclease V subunit gamma [Salinisphaera sp. Q1T1-3]